MIVVKRISQCRWDCACENVLMRGRESDYASYILSMSKIQQISLINKDWPAISKRTKMHDVLLKSIYAATASKSHECFVK
jgi:hypothetical protein